MSTYDYMSLMRISNNEVCKQFLHGCINDLIGHKSIIFDNFNNDIEWTKDDYTTTLKNIQFLYRSAAMDENFDLKTEIKGLNMQKQECVLQCFEIRKPEIMHSIILKNCAMNDYFMTDFDWKLKLIMGSSTLTNMTEPILELVLHCKKRNQCSTTSKSVIIEMNEVELNKLIKVLQDISS